MNDIGSNAPYFSLLLTAHGGKTVNIYVNGQPIGQIEGGAFVPKGFDQKTGVPTPVNINRLPDPFPFDSLAAFKTFLYGVVDKMELVEDKPATPAA